MYPSRYSRDEWSSWPNRGVLASWIGKVHVGGIAFLFGEQRQYGRKILKVLMQFCWLADRFWIIDIGLRRRLSFALNNYSLIKQFEMFFKQLVIYLFDGRTILIYVSPIR